MSAACEPRLPRSGLVLGAILILAGSPSQAQPRRPVYVGAGVCATCHDGAGMGHQTTIWQHSRHARAYASLAAPQAHAIAAISGVPVEPQKSPLCLGCHATAADAENWEKDETFSIRNGVQCEKCHGPGSEHAESWTAGGALRAESPVHMTSPSGADCMKCHKEKPSHTRSLARASAAPARPAAHPATPAVPFDLARALHELAHPTPGNGQRKTSEPAVIPPVDNHAKARYIGSSACAECHDSAEKGFAFSRWQITPHARAYASLGTPEAARMAVQTGVTADPQRSAACLKCHSTAFHRAAAGTADSYSILEGVGCESCHGPGSSHATERAARTQGAVAAERMVAVRETACLSCHGQAHGKPFDVKAAMPLIAHPAGAPALAERVVYKTPINVAFRPGGKEIWVACEASATVCVLDAAQRRKRAEIVVGGQPTGLAFSPDGQRAYVTNRLDDTLSVVDASAARVVATVPVGDEPHGVCTDRDGKTIYVLNTSSDDISVFDAASLRERKRLSASRSPWALAISPDGARILVTNALSRFVKFRESSQSEISIIDSGRATIDDRLVVPDANMLQGVAWHPSGRFALATLLRTKNLVPMTRMLQGWTVTSGLGLVWEDGRVDQVLLDQAGESFPDPTDVAVTPDGALALVTSAGSDQVAIVDLAQLTGLVQGATEDERRDVLPNHLGQATRFVTALVPTGRNPRGLAIAPDGKTAWVACALDDALTVIDIPGRKAAGTVHLGGPRVVTEARRGERLFHNAGISFHRQLSCHTCHPDGHVDGLTYDIEADGIGLAPVDNRTLRGILDTGPFKWAGTNPTLSRQCGPRLSVYFTRIQPFTPDELAAVDHYISTIARPPNRHRAGRGADSRPAPGQAALRPGRHGRRPADTQAETVRLVPFSTALY